jgi:hypothetical protein
MQFIRVGRLQTSAMRSQLRQHIFHSFFLEGYAKILCYFYDDMISFERFEREMNLPTT